MHGLNPRSTLILPYVHTCFGHGVAVFLAANTDSFALVDDGTVHVRDGSSRLIVSGETGGVSGRLGREERLGERDCVRP